MSTSEQRWKQWRELHPDYVEEPAKKKSRRRRWRDRHPEYGREYSKRWRAAHPDYHKEYAKRWRSENRDRMNAIAARYRENNREAIKVSRGLGVSVSAAREMLKALTETKGKNTNDRNLPGH